MASSTGWNEKKVAAFRRQFMAFLMHVRVNSKDKGEIVLGEHIYRAQNMLLDGIFDALAQDIHDIKVLKSRQLGITTLSRAFTLFWIGVHGGLRGYMVFDTSKNAENARVELLQMIKNLPAKLKFPSVERQNRYLLELSNGSLIQFVSAGVREGKGSNALGASSAVNFAHNSEMAQWGNSEGLTSYKQTFSDEFPNRLYIWESTARGFNLWHEMWTDAREDPTHQKCIFIGWWARDNQQIAKSHPDFLLYGEQPPSDDEIKKINTVREKYGWQVTPEQLAWIRRKMDPAAKPEGDAPAEFEGTSADIQEQPWTEDEAFQQTGATFFGAKNLTEITNKYVSKKFKTYSYSGGTEFIYCQVYPSHNAKSVELKVWEEPDEDGVYVVAVDPAFGANEHNDRSAIQVLRCYADGCDQVAEYAWPLVNTRQLAWITASLLGWYAGERAQVYNIIELNGPGDAVWGELKSLKHQISVGYMPAETEKRGLSRIFNNVRNYIYSRSDSMAPGSNYHFLTTTRTKVSIMERLRDFVTNEMLVIRSLDTIEEMKKITRSGDSIAAEGSGKDDRVMALAIGIRCWEERVRKMLTTQKRTRENEALKKRLTIGDQITLYNGNQLDRFFAVKAGIRRREAQMARRQQWRSGGR